MLGTFGVARTRRSPYRHTATVRSSSALSNVVDQLLTPVESTMTSRHLAVFLVAWLTVSCSLNARGAEQPNIVLIVADDLGNADLGYHDSTIKPPTSTAWHIMA